MYELAVTSVHDSAAAFGYLGCVVVHGERVWAAGGTYYKPTLLYSRDGGHSFTSWSTPNTPGLRGVHVEGDLVWVVGEYGMVATTHAGDGETWRRVATPAENTCLYTIHREPKGAYWITGDDGLVLRSRTGKRWEHVENHSRGRVLHATFEPSGAIWLLDSAGVLQRAASGRDRFEEVPIAAMRTKRPLTWLRRTRAGTLLLLGDGGLVLRSTNDGTSWKKIPIDSRVDLEHLTETRYGIFAVGDKGSMLVSHDDGRSFQGFDSALFGHLWTVTPIGPGDLLVTGDAGQIWRIDRAALAPMLRDAFATREPRIAALATRVLEGEPGAEMVLDDALLERE